MNRQTSIKLDLVRWLAAFMVFASHFLQRGVTLIDSKVIDPFSHLGVLVFFVLSGYVIRFVSDGRHPDARGYLEARWARINSVFLPALLFTVVFDLIGRQLDPALYARYPVPDLLHVAAYMPVFVTFMFENAFHGLRWFSNGPLWSVAYEVWYYIIFCMFFYFRGKARTVLTGLAMLFAGYKILLLMPLWLAGCMIYKHRDAIERVPIALRRVLCLCSLGMIIFLLLPQGHSLLDPLRDVGRILTGQGYHAAFLADYMMCVLLSVFLATFCSTGVFDLPAAVAPMIRWNVNYSFTLYAFHVPVLLLLRATGMYDPTDIVQVVAVGLLVIAICWAISLGTEQRKSEWRKIAKMGGDGLVRLAAAIGIRPSRERA